jgi:putative ABC transport system ATP-binding protein
VRAAIFAEMLAEIFTNTLSKLLPTNRTNTMLLTITKLVKHIGGVENPFTLRVPHFALEQGSQIALTGESGSGKTTLFHLISGLLNPDEGEVNLLGTSIGKLSEAKRDRFRAEHIGIIYQTFNLLQGFTALENVMLGAAFANGKAANGKAANGKTNTAARAQELLVRLGLQDRMNRKPAELSVGQQQRVAVARALIHKPALLLADEPTANVDAANGQKIIEEIRTLARESGATLLLVSHDANVVQGFAATTSMEALLQSSAPLSSSSTSSH